MVKQEKKDVMGDVINDISSAVEETAEDAAGVFEEAVDTAEEAAEVFEAAEFETAEEAAEVFESDTIVVKFDNELDAARAVRVLNKALLKRHDTIYQGALVSRDKDDEIKVEDLREMGLSDVITGTAGLGFGLGRDGVKLVWSAASAGAAIVVSGLRLLQRTAVKAAGLAGATRTLPLRRGLEEFYAEDDLESATVNLEPGATAVVIVAARETASELATDLVRSGGELI